MSFRITTRTRLQSFDGAAEADVIMAEPDRYGQIEMLCRTGSPLVARGGGYTYAGASFGTECMVLGMRRFNRVLAFEPEARRITVEPGMTLGALLAVVAPRGLIMPIAPGYPLITVGGCIAVNAHGKNPFRVGTMADWVERLELFHPDQGVRTLSRKDHPELFEATCGGFGLTGILLSATLRLMPLEGGVSRVTTVAASSLEAGLDAMMEASESSEFAYSWHDATPRAGVFGRGLVIHGGPVPGSPLSGPIRLRSKPLQPRADRGRFPLRIWGGLGTRTINGLYRFAAGLKSETSDVPLFDAMFPLADKADYFRLYGKGGLVESQVLVPQAMAYTYLHGLERALLEMNAPTVFVSLKVFRGVRSMLRFAGDGLCVSFDAVRGPAALELLTRIDRLTLECGGIPYLAKDSRLPAAVAAAAYGAGFDDLRDRLRRHDPQRRFRSELSMRLGL